VTAYYELTFCNEPSSSCVLTTQLCDSDRLCQLQAATVVCTLTDPNIKCYKVASYDKPTRSVHIL